MMLKTLRSSFEVHVPNSLAGVRSALEDRLIIILCLATPCISIFSCILSPSTTVATIHLLLNGCLPLLAQFKNKLTPIQKYCTINILTIGLGILLCFNFDTMYVGLLMFLLAAAFSVILRGIRVGITYTVFLTLVASHIGILHSLGYIADNYQRKDSSFWVPIISMTAVIMVILVYSLGFVYRSMTAILTEISLKNRVIQQMLETDKLTGLCNRWVMEERLRVILESQQRYGGITFVLFIDLDGFKAINDTYHHAAGDYTLKTIAKRLKSTMRPDDVVSRIGGDEFVIIAHIDHDDAEEARKFIQAIAKRILNSITEPILWENKMLSLGASIGIAEHLYKEAISAEELMHKADVEMFAIKRNGKSGGSMNGVKFTSI